MIPITPLEQWIAGRIGRGKDGASFAEALKDYQLRRLNETIRHARENAPFYRRRLARLPQEPFSALSDIHRLPFTTPRDIAGDPFGFLAVRQDDIARIVTLSTSGSTGPEKRVFFTESDLELTVDFFHHGMSTLVTPGQRVAVLLPGRRPDSVGDLLARGLARMDVETLVYGPVFDPIDAVGAVASFCAHCLVGIPTQLLAMARSPYGPDLGEGRVRTVLLSTDYVPRAIVDALEEVWGCKVFTHYGMTEMGLGGGVECEALDGYHLREGDLYVEVVHPETGETCPDGTTGEVVFTTLTRRGMPLIRYRTGDIAAITPGPCPCGSALRRLGRVRGRWDALVRLGPDCSLGLSEIDESLFRLPGVVDYRAAVSKGGDGRLRLTVDVKRARDGSPTDREVTEMLDEVDTIRKAAALGYLNPPIVRFTVKLPPTTGVSKRRILMSDEAPPAES